MLAPSFLEQKVDNSSLIIRQTTYCRLAASDSSLYIAVNIRLRTKNTGYRYALIAAPHFAAQHSLAGRLFDP